VRLGVRQMVSADTDLLVCGETDSAATALQSVKESEIDLAIVDLSLKDGGGLQLIKALRDAHLRSRCWCSPCTTKRSSPNAR